MDLMKRAETILADYQQASKLGNLKKANVAVGDLLALLFDNATSTDNQIAALEARLLVAEAAREQVATKIPVLNQAAAAQTRDDDAKVKMTKATALNPKRKADAEPTTEVAPAKRVRARKAS